MTRILFFILAITALAQDAAPPVLSILAQQIAKTEDANLQLNLLRGMNAALKGRRGVAAPPEWTALSTKLATSENQEIRELTQALGTIFGSSDAFAALRQTAANEEAEPAARRKALEALIAGKDAETAGLLKKLLIKPGPLRAEALRGLAAYAEGDTVDVIMAVYSQLAPEEKRDALATLAARPSWAKSYGWLLDGGSVPKGDVSATLIRQLRSFNDPGLNNTLDRHFGKMSVTNPDKQAEIAKIKEWLTADFIAAGNATKGRDLRGLSQALRGRRRDRPGDHRREPHRPRLPAAKHRRSQCADR
jgi:hypothetical protein